MTSLSLIVTSVTSLSLVVTSGHFLYVESTPSWHPLEAARTTSPRYVTGADTAHCLKFWYRFYGNELVFLHVLQRDEEGESDIWRAEGGSDGQWREVSLDLRPQAFTQVQPDLFS